MTFYKPSFGPNLPQKGRFDCVFKIGEGIDSNPFLTFFSNGEILKTSNDLDWHRTQGKACLAPTGFPFRGCSACYVGKQSSFAF